MTTETIHTCSYECERPGCIRAQRDELVSRLEALTAAQQQAVATPLPGDKGSVQALFNPTLQPMQQGGGEAVQRLRGVLEHGKMGDKCLIAPDLVTAAIAALSAQQPPAEAQPVAKLVNRKDADGGKTTTFIRPTGFGMDLPLGEYPLHLHPSAPTGDDRWKALIGQWQRRVEAAGYDGVEDALDALTGMAELVGLLDEVRSHFTRDDDLPDDLLPRIDAALAAQPQGDK